MSQHAASAAHESRCASIVIGVDGSRRSEPAVRWAAGVAAQRGRPVRIVHGLGIGRAGAVLGNDNVAMPAIIERLQRDAEEAVERARRTAHAVEPNLQVTGAVSPEPASHLLVEESQSAFQVVLGAAGSEEWGAGRIGSTVVAVAGHAHAPVVTVRHDGARPAPSAPVVLGVDDSAAGEAAIDVAFDEASWRRTHLVAVYVWSELFLGAFAERHETRTSLEKFEHTLEVGLAERLAAWQAKYPDVAVNHEIHLDGPRENLLRWSQRAQLLVVGSHGRGALDGSLLGPTSTALALQARCPVMVVPWNDPPPSE